MRNLIFLSFFLMLFYMFSEIPAQTWPFSSNASGISSTFGPRQMANYDFHEGIDLPVVNGTTIKAVKSGIVYDFYDIPASHPDENNVWVKVKNTDDTYTLYMHVVRDDNRTIGSTVTENTTIIGTVLDYDRDGDPSDHLHLELEIVPTELMLTIL